MRTISKARVALAAGVCGGLGLIAPLGAWAQTDPTVTTTVFGDTSTTAVGDPSTTAPEAMGGTDTTLGTTGEATDTTTAFPEGGVQAGGGYLAGEDGGSGAEPAALLAIVTVAAGGAMAVTLTRKRARRA